DLGFNTENIMQVKMYYPTTQVPVVTIGSKVEQDNDRKEILDKPEYIKNQLASFPGIKADGQGRSPLDIYLSEWKTKQGTSGFESFNTLIISTECQDIFGFELLEGRLFDKKIDTERSIRKIIINEAAKKYFDIEDISTTI